MFFMIVKFYVVEILYSSMQLFISLNHFEYAQVIIIITGVDIIILTFMK